MMKTSTSNSRPLSSSRIGIGRTSQLKNCNNGGAVVVDSVVANNRLVVDDSKSSSSTNSCFESNNNAKTSNDLKFMDDSSSSSASSSPTSSLVNCSDLETDSDFQQNSSVSMLEAGEPLRLLLGDNSRIPVPISTCLQTRIVPPPPPYTKVTPPHRISLPPLEPARRLASPTTTVNSKGPASIVADSSNIHDGDMVAMDGLSNGGESVDDCMLSNSNHRPPATTTNGFDLSINGNGSSSFLSSNPRSLQGRQTQPTAFCTFSSSSNSNVIDDNTCSNPASLDGIDCQIEDEEHGLIDSSDSIYRRQPFKAADRGAAGRLARRLFHLDGFRLTDVAKHLAKRNDFSQLVGEEFASLFDFANLRLDQALRLFLQSVALSGESQERERILFHFCRRYHLVNPNVYANEDCCHMLACALMLLNTELHAQNVARKISCQDFVANISRLPCGYTFRQDDLEELYEAVKQEPIRWPHSESAMLFANYTNFYYPPPSSQPPPTSNGLLQGPQPAPGHLRYWPNNGASSGCVVDSPLAPAGQQQALLPPLPNYLTNVIPPPPPDLLAREYLRGNAMRKWVMESHGKKTSLGRRGWKPCHVRLRDLTLYLYKNAGLALADARLLEARRSVYQQQAAAALADYQLKLQHEQTKQQQEDDPLTQGHGDDLEDQTGQSHQNDNGEECVPESKDIDKFDDDVIVNEKDVGETTPPAPSDQPDLCASSSQDPSTIVDVDEQSIDDVEGEDINNMGAPAVDPTNKTDNNQPAMNGSSQDPSPAATLSSFHLPSFPSHTAFSTDFVINLAHSLASRASDYAKRPNVLRLKTRDGAEYLFEVGDTRQLELWIDRINFVAALLSAPSMPCAVGSQRGFYRPYLPATCTKLSMHEQLEEHQRRLIELDRELIELKQPTSSINKSGTLPSSSLTSSQSADRVTSTVKASEAEDIDSPSIDRSGLVVDDDNNEGDKALSLSNSLTSTLSSVFSTASLGRRRQRRRRSSLKTGSSSSLTTTRVTSTIQQLSSKQRAEITERISFTETEPLSSHSANNAAVGAAGFLPPNFLPGGTPSGIYPAPPPPRYFVPTTMQPNATNNSSSVDSGKTSSSASEDQPTDQVAVTDDSGKTSTTTPYYYCYYQQQSQPQANCYYYNAPSPALSRLQQYHHQSRLRAQQSFYRFQGAVNHPHSSQLQLTEQSEESDNASTTTPLNGSSAVPSCGELSNEASSNNGRKSFGRGGVVGSSNLATCNNAQSGNTNNMLYEIV